MILPLWVVVLLELPFFFTLAHYTDLNNIILFEKYDEVSQLNSNPKANSQTLHVGDIESNYTYEKAMRVKKASSMVSNYIQNSDEVGRAGFVKDKILLAVGEAKIEKDGIIFNMTPSPGATSSLSIAKIDALSICETLGATFDSIKHVNEIECIKSSALKEPIFQEESRLQKLA